MNARLLLVALEREPDIVLVRKRTRRVAELLGFDRQDQTRITTAVSELARNAFEYAGGGRAEFRVRDDAAAPVFEIIISDEGPGIADLDAVLSGTHTSEKGMGVGLRGARRLMDAFDIESRPGLGTTVRVLSAGGRRIRTIGPAPAKGSSRRCQSETAAQKAEPLTGSVRSMEWLAEQKKSR
jgi:anti-sigma regulatory factor (Ser/Thr protein kinase)